MRLKLLVALLLTLGTLPAAPPASAQQTWLDAPLINWNPPGRPLPAASPSGAGSRDPQCVSRERAPATPEDRQVVAAGWGLWATYQAGWDVTIVQGTSDYDGMCRPMGYQAFVFYRGQFAGTVSPVPMASRYDGALSDVRYFPEQLIATFVRYADTDPLCCPSRPSVTATYRVVVTPSGPSLEPVDRG